MLAIRYYKNTVSFSVNTMSDIRPFSVHSSTFFLKLVNAMQFINRRCARCVVTYELYNACEREIERTPTPATSKQQILMKVSKTTAVAK